jgi:transcriptional regulator with GAF, ATPase, and Fis domain
MTHSLKNKVEFFERSEIVKALGECGWIMAQAARKLDISERMIGYKIKKYGIRKEAMKEPGFRARGSAVNDYKVLTES